MRLVLFLALACAARAGARAPRVRAGPCDCAGVSAPAVVQFSAATGAAGKRLAAGCLCLTNAQDEALHVVVSAPGSVEEINAPYVRPYEGEVPVITGFYGNLGIYKLPTDKKPAERVLLSQFVAAELLDAKRHYLKAACESGASRQPACPVLNAANGGRCAVLALAGGSGSMTAAEAALASLSPSFPQRGSRGERVVALCATNEGDNAKLLKFMRAAVTLTQREPLISVWRRSDTTARNEDLTGAVLPTAVATPAPVTPEELTKRAAKIYDDAVTVWENHCWFARTMVRQKYITDVTDYLAANGAANSRTNSYVSRLGFAFSRLAKEIYGNEAVNRKSDSTTTPPTVSVSVNTDVLGAPYIASHLSWPIYEMLSPSKPFSFLRAPVPSILLTRTREIINLMMTGSADSVNRFSERTSGTAPAVPRPVQLRAPAEVWTLLHFGLYIGCITTKDAAKRLSRVVIPATWKCVAETDDKLNRIFVDEQDKRVVVWVIGMQSFSDALVVMKMVSGDLTSSKRFISAERMLARARAEYPDYNVSVAGQSLGGAIAIKLAEMYGLHAEVFNPAPLPAPSDTTVKRGVFSAARGIMQTLSLSGLYRRFTAKDRASDKAAAAVSRLATTMKVANFDERRGGSATIHAVAGDPFCGGYFSSSVKGYQTFLYAPLYLNTINAHNQHGLMAILGQQPHESNSAKPAPTLEGKFFPTDKDLITHWRNVEQRKPPNGYDALLSTLFAALPYEPANVEAFTAQVARLTNEEVKKAQREVKENNLAKSNIQFTAEMRALFAALKPPRIWEGKT